MSKIAPPMADEPDDDGKAAIDAASDIIESEQENVKIEIEFAKAVRVGVLLRQWRDLMMGDGNGAPYPEEWVDHASMDIFHRFFPLSVEEITYYDSSELDEDDD